MKFHKRTVKVPSFCVFEDLAWNRLFQMDAPLSVYFVICHGLNKGNYVPQEEVATKLSVAFKCCSVLILPIQPGM